MMESLVSIANAVLTALHQRDVGRAFARSFSRKCANPRISGILLRWIGGFAGDYQEVGAGATIDAKSERLKGGN